MSSAKSSSRRSLRAILLWPLVVALVSLIGLLAALVGDGAWDMLSWLTLAVPVLLYGFYYLRPRPR
jgi:hypothetical protein